ncbi:SDR family NAD(P)-dependent oxidoreductase [candidate division GN15 bacterium]|nr:SDR family NAD(P)-dependent oxidoreductase [candidate division GN15 bacterium]
MSVRGKRILVTGAGGFIGSHLVEKLVNSGAQVRGLVHYNSLGRRGWLDYSPATVMVDVVSGDITDRDSVSAAMKDIDVVFHLAALIAIPYSYHAPESYVKTNVLGTLNVLQEALRHGVERVVHTSTSEVYGSARLTPISESHPLQAQSPYAASKIGADQMVAAMHRSTNLPVVVVRPFNTYGPRQSARAVIPSVIVQCLAGAESIKLGNLDPTRDLVYVQDTVGGLIAAARSDEAIGETIQLGTGDETSIGDLAETIIEVTESSAEIDSDLERVRPKASEVARLVADASKARRLLNWQPQFSLRSGLKRTVSWYRDHLDLYRSDEYIL